MLVTLHVWRAPWVRAFPRMATEPRRVRRIPGVRFAKLVGTGTGLWLPPPELRQALKAVRVVLDTMQTGPAVRTYNIMIGERRRVAAALIAVP